MADLGVFIRPPVVMATEQHPIKMYAPQNNTLHNMNKNIQIVIRQGCTYDTSN